MNQHKKRRDKDNVRCNGYGKCMTMEVETIVDNTINVVNTEIDINDELSEISSISDDSNSDVSRDTFKELPNIKTIFRFEPNEKCKHKCTLHKCENYKKCGNMLPQWSLNIGSGFCEQCVYDGLALKKQKEYSEQKRRYTI